MENEAMEVKEVAPIDPVLIEKMQAMRTLVQLDQLISNCLFPGGVAQDIVSAKQLIQGLHSPILKECQEHPDFERASRSPADQEAIDKAEAKRLRKLEKVKAQ